MLRYLTNFYKWMKSKMHPLVFYTGLIFAFSQIGAVLNFATNFLIVPKYLSPHELGLIAPITQYVRLGALPFGVISTFVIKFVTRYEANAEWGKLKCLTRDLFILGGASALVVAIMFVVSFDSFALRMGIESKWMLFWMLTYLCVSSCIPVIGLLTRSMQRFFIMALGGVLVPVALFFSAFILLPKYGLAGYMNALVISTLINVGVSLYAVYLYFAPHKEKPEPYFNDCKTVLKKYIVLFALSGGATWLWGFIPPFIIVHFLTDTDAAGFYFIQRLALLPTYVVSPLILILLPHLSSKHEGGRGTKRTVKASILYVLISGVIILSMLYLISPFIFSVMPQWRDYQGYAKYIWVMAISVILANVNGIISADFAAKWFFRHTWYRLPVTYGLVILLYCLFGWGAFKGVLPETIWTFVDTNVNRGILLVLIAPIILQFSMLLISLYWYWRIKRDETLILNEFA